MKKWEKIILYLTKAEFSKIWTGKDLGYFQDFLRNQAAPSGGFVVTFPLTEGGFVWFFYKIKEVKKDSVSVETPEVSVPNDDASQDAPNEYRGYPVWRVSKNIVY